MYNVRAVVVPLLRFVDEDGKKNSNKDCFFSTMKCCSQSRVDGISAWFAVVPRPAGTKWWVSCIWNSDKNSLGQLQRWVAESWTTSSPLLVLFIELSIIVYIDSSSLCHLRALSIDDSESSPKICLWFCLSGFSRVLFCLVQIILPFWAKFCHLFCHL